MHAALALHARLAARAGHVPCMLGLFMCVTGGPAQLNTRSKRCRCLAGAIFWLLQYVACRASRGLQASAFSRRAILPSMAMACYNSRQIFVYVQQ